jgi:propionate CoA-transferase
VGIIRATTADPDGNLTMEREALTLEALAIAMAAHNSGGIVIAQVERIAERGSLNPRQVKIPGVLVDCVVVAERPEHHQQTFATPYSPASRARSACRWTTLAPMPLSERKVIARRAALELTRNAVVNLGIGMPEGVAEVAAEEKMIDLLTLTAEPGVIGGIPASGLNFGAAVNTQAVIDQPTSSTSTTAAGSTWRCWAWRRPTRRATSTSAASARGWPAPAASSTSASRPRRWSSWAPSPPATCRCGGGGRLHIVHEGTQRKFVRRSSTAPSAASAPASGQRVLYVTERCVFRLVEGGLELIEIAPGIDLQRDILAQMDFMPAISPDLKLMDARLFDDAPLGLRERC